MYVMCNVVHAMSRYSDHDWSLFTYQYHLRISIHSETHYIHILLHVDEPERVYGMYIISMLYYYIIMCVYIYIFE